MILYSAPNATVPDCTITCYRLLEIDVNMELKAGKYVFDCYPMPWSIYELGISDDPIKVSIELSIGESTNIGAVLSPAEAGNLSYSSNNAFVATVDETGKVDTRQFVRFDQYGLYGIQDAPEVYVPESEAQIYNDANFGLTWNKFFMKR